MKRHAVALLSSIMILTGCSDKQTDDVATTSTPTEQPAAQQTPLEIVKQYSEAIGELEAYYQNDALEASTQHDTINLNITSVEYGKLLPDALVTGYDAYKDADGKVTYIKLGMNITGDVNALAQHTFFAYQGDVLLNGQTFFADSSYSDKILISPTQPHVTSGFLYIIVDAALPLDTITYSVAAPFDNDTNNSIAPNYAITIEL